MLWACFHFRDLPLHAVFDDDERKSACAVADGPPQRPGIALANAPAQRAGIRTGHVLAVARAVCPALQARQRDAAAEQRLLLSLAAWAYQFSSHVSLSGPDALLIEIGASLRLFGGWPALERRLRGELAVIGHAPALAVAPVPAAARVLAGLHDGLFIDQREPMLTALGCVPVGRSGLGEKAITLLHHVGMRTLREVFALPRAELARRIGPAELDALDRMRGAQQILPPYRPPDRFAHRIEFEGDIDAWPPLLFPLRRLCGELALFLAARDGGVQRCEIVLEHEDKAATRIPVELLAPQRDAKTLYELLRSRLERAELVAPAGAMALLAKDLPALCPRHRDLFEPQREQGLEWPALAERLRAHLGDGAVRRLAIAEDHRPEYAWRLEGGTRQVGHSPLPPAGEAAPQARVRVAHEAAAAFGSATLTPTLSRQRERGKSSAPEFLQRPLWLLPHAIPLRGDPPRILAGPERIESGWWDGGDARRDYYVVQTRDGQRAWAYVPAGASGGWMLHGWFA